MPAIYTDLSKFIDDVTDRAAITFYYGSNNQAVIGYAGIHQLVTATFIDTACSYIPGQSTMLASSLATDIFGTMRKLATGYNPTLIGLDLWWDWIDQNINLHVETRVLEVRNQLGGVLTGCYKAPQSNNIYFLT